MIRKGLGNHARGGDSPSSTLPFLLKVRPVDITANWPYAFTMLIAVILLGIAQIVAILLVPVLIRRAIDAKQRELQEQAHLLLVDWLNPPAPDKLSKLGEFLQKAGALVGQSAAHSIMASLSADASHAARAANEITETIEAKRNPLAMLMGGKRGKGAAIQSLLETIGPLLGQGAGAKDSRGGNGPTPNQSSFSL